MLYTTKTLTRDGITYTASFREAGESYRVTGFKISAAGQVIDVLKDAPKSAPAEVVDAWFIKAHPKLSMLADDVYMTGIEVSSELVRDAA